MTYFGKSMLGPRQALNLHAGGAGASMNALDHNQCLRQKNSTIPMANVPARPITNQKANG